MLDGSCLFTLGTVLPLVRSCERLVSELSLLAAPMDSRSSSVSSNEGDGTAGPRMLFVVLTSSEVGTLRCPRVRFLPEQKPGVSTRERERDGQV